MRLGFLPSRFYVFIDKFGCILYNDGKREDDYEIYKKIISKKER